MVLSMSATQKRSWKKRAGIAALALATLASTGLAQSAREPATALLDEQAQTETTSSSAHAITSENIPERKGNIRRRLPSTCGDECIINYLHAALIGTGADADDMNAYKPLLAADLWPGIRQTARTMITSNEYAQERRTITSQNYQTPFETLTQLYGTFLFRAPDRSGIHTYLPMTQAGAESTARVAEALINSNEFTNSRERILKRERPAISNPLRLHEKIYNGRLVKNDFYGSIEHDGLTRTFFLRVPDTYFTNSSKAPLALILHHSGGSGEADSNYFPKSVTEPDGAIMLYPDGTPATEFSGPNTFVWNVGHCCGQAPKRGIDDVSFLAALIGRMQSQFLVDSDRVYVTGFSNGGMMSQYFAASRPDLIAAAGATAGSVGGCKGAGCDQLAQNIILPPAPSTSVPIMMFHGFNDTTVPPQGGYSSGSSTWYLVQFSRELTALHPEWPQPTGPGANIASLDFWVEANGLTNAPVIEQVPHKDGNMCTRITYDLPEGGAKAIGYACQGLGHYHPTCNGAPQPCVDGPAILWNFFMSNKKGAGQ